MNLFTGFSMYIYRFNQAQLTLVVKWNWSEHGNEILVGNKRLWPGSFFNRQQQAGMLKRTVDFVECSAQAKVVLGQPKSNTHCWFSAGKYLFTESLGLHQSYPWIKVARYVRRLHSHRNSTLEIVKSFGTVVWGMVKWLKNLITLRS